MVQLEIMDSLPPNDPNNNGNHNNNDRSAEKNISQNGGGNNRNGLNENGEMEIFGGNLGDQGAVFALFLMGLASYILRERCIC